MLSMDLQDKPTWSKKKLHKLGKALLAGSVPPEGCPTYDEVMFWHHELASVVAGIIDRTDWQSIEPILHDVQLRVSSRGKTIDTLIQKLERSNYGLEDIQDIAGVRVDGDFTLTQQSLFAEMLADYFDVDERGKRDLRNDPHSGYRAFHLWVRCPAGRIEIQIRTVGQSEWANTYERIGDVLGRGIRYDEPADSELLQNTPGAREFADQAVSQMHELSRSLQVLEAYLDFVSATKHVGPEYFDTLANQSVDAETDREIRQIQQAVEHTRGNSEKVTNAHQDYVEAMQKIRRMVDQLEEV